MTGRPGWPVTAPTEAMFTTRAEAILKDGLARLEADPAQKETAVAVMSAWTHHRDPLRGALSAALARHLDLSSYDILLVNTSAGKDSQVMLGEVVRRATEAGIKDRVIAVHADLGDVEWEGTKELAAEQAAAYGVRLEYTSRAQGLLEHVIERGRWPDAARRFCTSDHKRGPVRRVMTRLAEEVRFFAAAHITPEGRVEASAAAVRALRKVCTLCGTDPSAVLGQLVADRGVPLGQLAGASLPEARRVQIRAGAPVTLLNCMGLRAQESTKREQDLPYVQEESASSGRRTVDTWLPIHQMTTDEVWASIRASGVRHHPAYDLGMPRLSCCFCIFAPKDALLLAGRHNPKKLEQYVAVERLTGHRFKQNLALADIQRELAAGVRAGPATTPWSM